MRLAEKAVQLLPVHLRGQPSAVAIAESVAEACEERILQLEAAVGRLMGERRPGPPIPGDDRAFWDEGQEPTL